MGIQRLASQTAQYVCFEASGQVLRQWGVWSACLPYAADSYARYSTPAVDKTGGRLQNVRNLGISAHIDSGKTTLTERILFYTGRIKQMHEVRGRDGVGAKMDSMELERERGITIKSAATYTNWKDVQINIIDTPGHVDFTIEVERSLRVLDGAILVLCSVGGVQSQTVTVDRQMKRYDVPRIAFINKLDRLAADPEKVLQQMRDKLKANCAFVQLNIGIERDFDGVVDLLDMQAYTFSGKYGETVEARPFPEELREKAQKYRTELIEMLCDLDDDLASVYLTDESQVTKQMLQSSIRAATIRREFYPVFVGAAYKNLGVQLLLDAVKDYLPSPVDVTNTALTVGKNEEKVQLPCDVNGPLVAYAFKLEDGQYGSLTFLRIYSGVMKKGAALVNMRKGEKVRFNKLVRLHSDEMEEIQSAQAGDVVAAVNIDCASGDTFTDGTKYAMTTMFVPEPVISLAVHPKTSQMASGFTTAVNRFVREDPTFQFSRDDQTGQMIIHGMGELHLDIYLERMKREYGVECVTGKPKVNFQETLTKRASFEYLHKKQSGGAGQYGGVQGYIEPLSSEIDAEGFEFKNRCPNAEIGIEHIGNVEKGFKDARKKGMFTGTKVLGVRIVLEGGKQHPVDSNEVAFRIAANEAFKEAYRNSEPIVLEPIMQFQARVPQENQNDVIIDLNMRRSSIEEVSLEDDEAVIDAKVPLAEMFGYAQAIRKATSGSGEFTMEYYNHQQVPPDVQEEMYKRKKW